MRLEVRLELTWVGFLEYFELSNCGTAMFSFCPEVQNVLCPQFRSKAQSQGAEYSHSIPLGSLYTRIQCPPKRLICKIRKKQICTKQQQTGIGPPYCWHPGYGYKWDREQSVPPLLYTSRKTALPIQVTIFHVSDLCDRRRSLGEKNQYRT